MPPKATSKSKPKTSSLSPTKEGLSLSHEPDEEFILDDTEVERREELRVRHEGTEKSIAQYEKVSSDESQLSPPPSSDELVEDATAAQSGSENGGKDIATGGSRNKPVDSKGSRKANESESGKAESVASNDHEHDGERQDNIRRGDGDDEEQQEGHGPEEQDGANGGNAQTPEVLVTTRYGRGVIARRMPGFVRSDQRFPLRQATISSSRQRGNAGTGNRAPARMAPPGRAPAKHARRNDHDLADDVDEIVTSTIKWLRDGHAIADRLEQSQDALVGALKRAGSSGGGGTSKKNRKG